MPRVRCLKPKLRSFDQVRAKLPPKESDPFYKSPGYQEWRKKIIARAGGRCEWPGCGRSGGRMFADHIVEIKDEGARFELANGQCLCAAHHNRKTAQEKAKRRTNLPNEG